MTGLPFKFDEIGAWSELKLEIVEQYGAACTKAFARTPRLKKFYLDGFSGAGVHVAKKTKAQIEGSPGRTLKVQPPFDGIYFIDLNADKTEYLRAVCGDRKDVDIHTSDSNDSPAHGWRLPGLTDDCPIEMQPIGIEEAK